MKRMELHFHTRFSHDSTLSFLFMLIMLKIRKIDIVAITEHNNINGGLYYKDKLSKYNIKCVIGEEINTTKGEIIGLFLKEEIPPGLSPRETMIKIKEQNGLVYIPHPCDDRRRKTVLDEEEIYNNLDLVDVIEFYNGRTRNHDDIEKCKDIYLKTGKVGCVGSDTHTFFEIGRNYIIIDDFKDKSEFIKNIESATYVTNKCMEIAHFNTKIDRALKYIEGGDIIGLYRTIYRKCKKKFNKFSQDNRK